jgi:hypothetical protein
MLKHLAAAPKHSFYSTKQYPNIRNSVRLFGIPYFHQLPDFPRVPPQYS